MCSRIKIPKSPLQKALNTTLPRQLAMMMLPPPPSIRPNLLGRSGIVSDERWVLLSPTVARVSQSQKRKLPLCPRRMTGIFCSSSSTTKTGETGYAEKKDEVGYYLASEFGWGVRRMLQVGEEMRSVAYTQAEAFHVPVFLFDDFFFQFFQVFCLSQISMILYVTMYDSFLLICRLKCYQLLSIKSGIQKQTGRNN